MKTKQFRIGRLATFGQVIKALGKTIRAMSDGSLDSQVGARICNGLGIMRACLEMAALVPPPRPCLSIITHEGDDAAAAMEKALAEHVACHPEDAGRTVEDFNWIGGERGLSSRRVQEHARWYSDAAYWSYSPNALAAGALDAELRAILRKEVSLEHVEIEFERVMKAVPH